MATALSALDVAARPSPLARIRRRSSELTRLRAALGPACPRLFIKRDDLLSFGFGGNKVRKMQTVAAEAMAAGADTLITCGGVQSNHARVTAAAGAALGLHVMLVLNRRAVHGVEPRRTPATPGSIGCSAPRCSFVAFARGARAGDGGGRRGADRAAAGRRSSCRSARPRRSARIGFARGVAEVVVRRPLGPTPSSTRRRPAARRPGSSPAARCSGCRRVSSASAPTIRRRSLAPRHSRPDRRRRRTARRETRVDRRRSRDRRRRPQVGDGYGVPTPASTEAHELVARREGIVLDPVYTAKAMAGLIARDSRRGVPPDETVLFWHTGGMPGYFA